MGKTAIKSYTKSYRIKHLHGNVKKKKKKKTTVAALKDAIRSTKCDNDDVIRAVRSALH